MSVFQVDQQQRKQAIWPGTIRMRVFLLVVIAASLLATVRIMQLRDAGDVQVLRARAQAVDLAETGVKTGIDFADQARLTLSILSQVPALKTGSSAECSALLVNVQKTRDWIAGIYATDTTGRVICATSPEMRDTNLAHRPYVQKAIATGSFATGEFRMDPNATTPVIGSALPVYDEQGRLQRVLVASIAAPWINSTALKVMADHPGSCVTLIDGNGIVLAEAPVTPDGIGRFLASDSMRAGLEKMQGSSFDGVGNNGAPYIFGTARLPYSNAILIVGLSRDAVLADVEQGHRQALASLAMMCLALGLVIWLFSAWTLDTPIQAMLAHARRIGDGELDGRIDSSRWPQELAMLAESMNLMAARIERRNKELNSVKEKLRQQTLTDPLTGLANRRAFDEQFDQVWQAAQATIQPLSLAIIDVDHFKRYNDTYGHVSGDLALEQLGSILQSLAHDASGMAARLGGEEFAILMPDHDEEKALRIADMVCMAVRALDIQHSASSHGRMTVSIGVAAVLPEGPLVDRQVLRHADNALYLAKASGRDHATGASQLEQLSPQQGQGVMALLA